MKRKQRASGERLQQEVVENYRKLRKRNGVFSLILVIVLLISGFGLFNLITSNGYGDKKVAYDQQLTTLNQQREDILSGKKVTVNQSFKTTMNDNLANLKEYPKNVNNYDVAIKDTNGHLTINKNNIFVSDNAKMLSQKTKEKIYQLNKQLAASTNGAQFEVVTVPELPRGEDIESYANKIFNQLGIGDKNENNGVLYLVALDEREFRLEVGYGLEGLIPDGKADDIISNEDVVDAFKDEDYDRGVNQVLDEVFAIMNTKTALVDSQIKKVESERTQMMFFHWTGIVVLGVLLFVSLIFVINLLRARLFLKESYKKYQVETTSLTGEEELQRTVKHTELYHILLSGLLIGLSVGGVKRAIIQGRLLKNPSAEKKMFGRILIGDTLYSGNGDVLTTAYLASNYNSSNWSDNNSGSGGGSSWGSFGGGSSGGGGASGGW
ncbi:TPM domain-containing protein [Enterococcus pseudoavium]|uniref:TPM domain-containing protein n=1 Tax=Enterococcus pseudoavium TaxID=44007 RepID=A0AAE4I0R6_9ENTE|nr:TPM domain-containing protein [Enterococcus pseudoavium]MDT2736423.1 TPM domain-containing protein [Enterococcus pseudoavium]MDT2755461.1 TPM domain-containing protein [Enterococcus pseudoavium]MDT2771683.1 TPM domain-containing protein [Enterococcus pseudoavium]